MIEKLAFDEKLASLLERTLRLGEFFSIFTVDQAKTTFPRSDFHFYPKWACLVEQGKEGRDLFVVAEGLLAVFRHDGERLKRVGSLKDGDIFGEIALLHNGVRTATVVAHEESRIFRLDHADIDYLLKHNPHLGDHLSHLAKRRLHALAFGKADAGRV